MLFFSIIMPTRFLQPKWLVQVNCEQPRWIMSHTTQLARPSKCQTCLCKNGIGDLTHTFCFHTSGMQCHLIAVIPSPPSSKYKICAYFDRAARKSS